MTWNLPPLLSTRELSEPEKPTFTELLAYKRELAPATVTVLLRAALFTPMLIPTMFETSPPDVMVSWFRALSRPTSIAVLLPIHCEPAPETRILLSLEFGLPPAPICVPTPPTSLVKRVLPPITWTTPRPL